MASKVRAERRLAAIMAADIVGYSRLIEADEAGTLAAIKALREEVIDPLLAEHNGRIVKLMGDGAIVEFGSVVDAVSCAVAVQKEVAARQAEVPPENRIVFRIGINLGDVVIEGDDLLGDGVNVAARLEQLCDPGGVLLSGTAYDHLRGKLDLPLDYAGEQRVKNIAQPVRTYRVRLDGSGQPWRLRFRQHRRGILRTSCNGKGSNDRPSQTDACCIGGKPHNINNQTSQSLPYMTPLAVPKTLTTDNQAPYPAVSEERGPA